MKNQYKEWKQPLFIKFMFSTDFRKMKSSLPPKNSYPHLRTNVAGRSVYLN